MRIETLREDTVKLGGGGGVAIVQGWKAQHDVCTLRQQS